MIERAGEWAVALVEAQGWDYEILFPLHLALVVQYPPLRVFNPMNILSDGWDGLGPNR